MQPSSKRSSGIITILGALLISLACSGGCGWKPWRAFIKRSVQVQVREAYGDRSGFYVAGTLLYADSCEPVARHAPVSLDVTVESVTRTVRTDDRGRFELALTPADFQRAELPGGDMDLIFRLAAGEDRRCGIRFSGYDAQQQDLVHISAGRSNWAVVVILHDLPMAGGAAAGKASVGSPAHLKQVLGFLRREAIGDPPAVFYMLDKNGPCCRQISSFLDVHRLPNGGVIARPAGDEPVHSAEEVDLFQATALRRLSGRIPSRKLVVLGRLGTGDGPKLFESKGPLGLRLTGAYLQARRGEPWPKNLKKLIVLTSIKRMDSLSVLARDLQEAGLLPVEAIGRAKQLDW